MKLEAEAREFLRFLRSLEQFTYLVKTSFGTECFFSLLLEVSQITVKGQESSHIIFCPIFLENPKIKHPLKKFPYLSSSNQTRVILDPLHYLFSIYLFFRLKFGRSEKGTDFEKIFHLQFDITR